MTSAYESGKVLPILMRHRLRISREEAGLDQEQLAAEIGVARRTIINAETGTVQQPRRILLKAWALACGVRLSWLLTGEGGIVTPPPSNGDNGHGQTNDADGQPDSPVGCPVIVCPGPALTSAFALVA